MHRHARRWHGHSVPRDVSMRPRAHAMRVVQRRTTLQPLALLALSLAAILEPHLDLPPTHLELLRERLTGGDSREGLDGIDLLEDRESVAIDVPARRLGLRHPDGAQLGSGTAQMKSFGGEVGVLQKLVESSPMKGRTTLLAVIWYSSPLIIWV